MTTRGTWRQQEEEEEEPVVVVGGGVWFCPPYIYNNNLSVYNVFD